MKVLISGIIGAAVATAAWLALEHFTLKEFGWLACLVGFVTGLAIHSAAGAHARASFGRGALAVILTLAACVGGRLLYVKVMESVRADLNEQMAQVAEPKGGEVADAENGSSETSDEGGEAAEPKPAQPPEADMPAASMKLQKPSMKTAISQGDMLWLCLAALIAYVVGKGSDGQPTAAEPVAAPEQPSAEPQ